MESKKVRNDSNFKPPQALDIDVKNLSFTIPARKKSDLDVHILNSVTTFFKSGKVTGILGPVGAGKTSFLNCLNKRASKGIDGSITINEEPLKKKHKKLMGYVLQRDYLFSKLNVQDSLLFTASLRRGDLSFAQRESLVDEILELMRLTSTKKTLIGDPMNHGVSGGELKRVNISTELISNPSIFLLDEPTSGLDSSSAIAILDTLNQLTRLFNMNVILSIHQPSSQAYSMLDQIILLHQGHFVYQGPGNELINYMEAIGFEIPLGWNISDYAMEVLDNPSSFVHMQKCYSQLLSRNEEGLYFMDFNQGNIPEKIESIPNLIPIDSSTQIDSDSTFTPNEPKMTHKALLSSTDETNTSFSPQFQLSKVETEEPLSKKIQLNNFKSPSWFTLLYYLVIRGLKKDFRGETVFYVFLQVIILAFITGALWWQSLNEYTEENLQDRFGFIFFCISNFMFVPAYVGLLTFLEEREIISKERATKSFGISPYLFSKTISDIAIFSLTPTVNLVIIYGMIGLPFTANQLFGLWGSCMISLFVSHSIGMAVASMVTRFQTGSLILTVFLLGCLLTGGFFIAYENIPDWLGWVRWLSVMNYTVSIFTYVNFNGYFFECAEDTESSVCPIPGSELMKVFVTGLGPFLDIVCLLVLWVVTKVITYIFLRWGKQLKMAS